VTGLRSHGVLLSRTGPSVSPVAPGAGRGRS
jgi:hypothetical protein